MRTLMTEQPDDLSSSRKDRRRIWVGSIISNLVVAILFAIFFQNIATAISNLIVNIIGTFYKGYIDSLYNQAAESPSDFLLLYLLVLIVFMPGFVVIVFWVVSNIATKLATDDKTIKSRTTYRMLLFAPFPFVIFLFGISGPIVSIEANAKFQRRLMLISPVISQQEKNEFLGKWARMKSQDDYNKIMDDMQSVAKKYGSELPKP
jgi:hypothetical protein